MHEQGEFVKEREKVKKNKDNKRYKSDLSVEERNGGRTSLSISTQWDLGFMDLIFGI